jgi:hypothetical protein
MPEKREHLTWPEAAAELFDLLTGRKAEVTYQFENLEVHVPIEAGSETEYAIWKLNGAIKVRARENGPA